VKSNPHIHQVIDVILEVQSETELKIRSIKKNTNNYLRKESIESIGHRVNLWTKYRSDEIDQIKYLKIIRNCYYGK